MHKGRHTYDCKQYGNNMSVHYLYKDEDSNAF